MNNDIKSAIDRGELVLFLGAGASIGCHSSNGNALLDGDSLAEFLANRASLNYSNESLPDVYSAAKSKLQNRLNNILEQLFLNVRPSPEYRTLAKYAWRRIYSLNIDDGLERALVSSKQTIAIRLSSHPYEERDQFFDRLDLIKLNGSINRLNDGVIFSSSDYAKATARALPWYEQCASDFARLPFLFIGTKIDEPLLKFHIERFKIINGSSPGRSYVITPNATDIQKQALSDFNISHISGTLSTFTSWLDDHYPNGITPIQLAKRSIPALSSFETASNPEFFFKLMDGVTHVTSDMAIAQSLGGGVIRQFYKGFQPTWPDIIDGVAAELDVLTIGMKLVSEFLSINSIISFIGPAGSGKTTLLMQICYQLTKIRLVNVYFIQEPIANIKKTILALDQTAENGYVNVIAIDNIDIVADEIFEVLDSDRLSNTKFIVAERQNSWNKRTHFKLKKFTIKEVLVNQFSFNDTEKIINKIQQYGSWTILGQLSKEERIRKLFNGANKQLLIALMEATYGRGYGDIITSDYNSLSSNEERMFFLMVALITEQNLSAPVSLIDRALNITGALSKTAILSEHLAGIIISQGRTLFARHQVYARYLLVNVIPPEHSSEAIKALLQVFSHYKSPVIKNLDKREATIYKKLINHKFLWDILKGNRTLIIGLYNELEKFFEQDGLFWLQYGLALRDQQLDQEALDKLRTAYSAYQMAHTQHALGQQLLIIGCMSDNKELAATYAEEARQLLLPLDEIIDSDDTYPLVTLAEGHTKLILNHNGTVAAQEIARSYLHMLEVKCRAHPNNVRLDECRLRIFKFAATGNFVEPRAF